MATKIYPAERKEVSQKLTEYEKDALEAAKGKDWFRPELEFWHYKSWSRPGSGVSHMIRRPEFVANKLYEKGYMERRLVGEYPFIHFEYRVINSSV